MSYRFDMNMRGAAFQKIRELAKRYNPKLSAEELVGGEKSLLQHGTYVEAGELLGKNQIYKELNDLLFEIDSESGNL